MTNYKARLITKINNAMVKTVEKAGFNNFSWDCQERYERIILSVREIVLVKKSVKIRLNNLVPERPVISYNARLKVNIVILRHDG